MKATPNRQTPTSAATAQLLNEHEWNFANAGALPNDELEACYLYEYAREFFKTSEPLKRLRRRWQKYSQKDKDWEKSYLAWVQAFDLLASRQPHFPRIDFKLYPMTAWRELPTVWLPKASPKSKQNIRRYSASSVNEWSNRERDRPTDRLHIETLGQLEPANIRSMQSFKFYHELFARRFSEKDYGFFAISWDAPDSEIRRAFEEWLRQRRDERAKSGLDRAKKSSNRGGFRDKLSWLGALRVKNHFRHRDLVNHADTNLKVAAPYSHYPDLLKASKKATQEIARLFPQEWSEAAWKAKQREMENIPIPTPKDLGF